MGSLGEHCQAIAGAAATLPDQILRAADLQGSTEVRFAGAERTVTTNLRDLVMSAKRVAGALQRRGLGPGDVVAIQLPNWYEGAVAQTAVALCGATLLPIVQIYGRHELGWILHASGASWLFIPGTGGSRDHLAEVASLRGVTNLRTIVVGERSVGAMLTFGDLMCGRTGSYSVPTVESTDCALLVYTSGTTAEPKGVQHSHASLLAEVCSPAGLRDPADPGRRLAAFPTGHVAGLLGLLRILIHGITTVVLDAWDAERAAALIDTHRLTWGSGAPVHLDALLDQRDRGGASLTSLHEFLVGAAGVSPALIERASAAGIAAYRAYGTSEHPTISSGFPDDPLPKRANTDGQLVEGNEIRLVNDDGVDVPVGSPGEIVSRGPELFLGYTDPELNRDAFLPGGWFRTGDVGRFDADGFLTIIDRKKDIIVRGGENISAKEVEDVLGTHPAIAEAAAIGVPDDRYGERVCAVVVTGHGVTVDLDELGAHFAAVGVARQKTPERLVVVDKLPRTSSGKVQKHLLRQRVCGQRHERSD